jgi:hypothetical protein
MSYFHSTLHITSIEAESRVKKDTIEILYGEELSAVENCRVAFLFHDF